MRAIVTCGPSYEPIDDVRRITNFSTGTLGVKLANALSGAGHEVTILKGVSATTQLAIDSAHVVQFSTNDDLLARLESVPDRETVGAFFHVAALADFRVRRSGDGARKLSSRTGEITITLEPAAKVIAELRRLFPNARIAGWKYELDGTRADALARGAAQIAENGTDLCIVNGAAYGSGFGILHRNQAAIEMPEADALCDWLVRWCGAP